MEKWIMVAVIVGLLVVAGIVASMTTTVIADEPSTKTTETTSCTGCGNSCTAESNCGLQSCGAVSGRSCGCGK